MTTGSTSTVLDNSSDSGFRTWGNELMTMLITTLGLTQTADSGQLAFPMTATARPAVNTAAGYYILRFNDTLQSTTPIFIKIELGSGSTQSFPQIWVTVGTGSSGGTLSGAGTRVTCNNANGPLSTVTNYTSRACYNATQGVLWINWKQGGTVANQATFDFLICRSVDNTGAPTSTAIGFQSASTTATAADNSGQPFQWYDAATTSWVGPAASGGYTGTFWAFAPYGTLGTAPSTVYGTAGQIFPCFQFAPTASAPALGVMNAMALCSAAEIPLGTTVSVAVLGSTTLTYIAIQPCSANVTGTAYVITTYLPVRLWQ